MPQPDKRSVLRSLTPTRSSPADTVSHCCLVARTTPGGRLTKTVPANEAEFLESMLIGRALQRNEDLKNVTHATFLKKLHVPGLVNPKKGVQPRNVREFTSLF